MAHYRGIEIPQHLCNVLPFMENVDECREALQTLGQQWDLLDVLSRVIETGTEVQQTRSEFQALNSDLIAALADESLRKLFLCSAQKLKLQSTLSSETFSSEQRILVFWQQTKTFARF